MRVTPEPTPDQLLEYAIRENIVSMRLEPREAVVDIAATSLVHTRY